jgi:hypothetical protein
VVVPTKANSAPVLPDSRAASVPVATPLDSNPTPAAGIDDDFFGLKRSRHQHGQ